MIEPGGDESGIFCLQGSGFGRRLLDCYVGEGIQKRNDVHIGERHGWVSTARRCLSSSSSGSVYIIVVNKDFRLKLTEV